MLLDILEDVFGDWILKVVRRMDRKLTDCRLARPRLAAAGKVLLFLFLALGSTAWFVLRARIAWAAGEEAEMKLFLGAGLLCLICGVFVGVKHLLRWRKQRKETMYDPRYQK